MFFQKNQNKQKMRKKNQNKQKIEKKNQNKQKMKKNQNDEIFSSIVPMKKNVFKIIKKISNSIFSYFC